MASKNNRAPPLYYIKLCASFKSHGWIQTGVTVRKCSIRVKTGNFFLSCVILKFDRWPWKTMGHLFYTISSFVHHFKAMGEFKLELVQKHSIQVKISNFQLWPSSSINASVRPSVTSFSLCFLIVCIIMKFSGVITNDRSEIHAKGQGQRSNFKMQQSRKIIRPWPKSHQLCRWSRYTSMPNFGPFLQCVLRMPKKTQFLSFLGPLEGQNLANTDQNWKISGGVRIHQHATFQVIPSMCSP